MVSPYGFEIVLNIACSESLTSLNLIFASATATKGRIKKYTKTTSLLRAKQEKKFFSWSTKCVLQVIFLLLSEMNTFNYPLDFISGISQKNIFKSPLENIVNWNRLIKLRGNGRNDAQQCWDLLLRLLFCT